MGDPANPFATLLSAGDVDPSDWLRGSNRSSQLEGSILAAPARSSHISRGPAARRCERAASRVPPFARGGAAARSMPAVRFLAARRP
jgi:hypothetical protein